MAAATVEAQPPRSSSNGPADSYLGSLISLTSKSEIRYEGVLFNINTEESSIGLRNVRSFGTEGRKKDGPQIPPSDKFYEYILFRGSDIKDLQVKSSPPVQTNTSVHDDPAIIQTHYSQAVPSSTSLPSSGIASIPDVSAHTPQMGLPKPTFQSSLPMYQPLGSLGSWGSTAPPTTNGSGIPMTMYWQGFSGPSNGFQHQQHSLLLPPPMQQPMLYPTINASLSAGSSGFSTSKPSESPSAFLPPLSMGTPNLHSHMLPAQSPPLTIGTLGDLQSSVFPSKASATVSESSSSLILNKASTETLHTAAPSTSLPLVSPLTTALDKTNILLPASDKPKTGSTPVMQLTSESAYSMSRTSGSILAEGAMPPLVTPGQFFQPDLTMVSSSQPSQTAQRDVEVVKVSSSELPPSPPAAAKDSQESILPLPAQSTPKPHGAHAFPHQSYRGGRERGGHAFTHQSYRGGRERGGHTFTHHQSYRGGHERGGHAFTHQSYRGSERGRGNRISRPMTRFTEDFDFTAMNEKFNKDEVWGDLGKSNKVLEDGGESQDEDDVGALPCDDTKNVYVKDDFFDSLSCDALDRGSQNGRTKFSEQLKKDTETFGYSPRHRGGRGGRWNGGGGRWNGSYGRGYGYAGPGRGHNFPNRSTY
ncbi:hypothetical protein M0R45_033107 [Rubus argutus]|uniref:Protein decapping 5-like n=1 Tax=Rubus argutus TaxID=59490 RepID=A0AAW1WLD8_RUBAR